MNSEKRKRKLNPCNIPPTPVFNVVHVHDNISHTEKGFFYQWCHEMESLKVSWSVFLQTTHKFEVSKAWKKLWIICDGVCTAYDCNCYKVRCQRRQQLKQPLTSVASNSEVLFNELQPTAWRSFCARLQFTRTNIYSIKKVHIFVERKKWIERWDIT